MIINPPTNQKLKTEEFLQNLKTTFKTIFEKELKNEQYKKDPIKYRRLGFNEFLEKSLSLTYHVFIPKEKAIKVIKIQNWLHSEYMCQMRVDVFDKNVSMLIIRGTRENVSDLIEYLRMLVEDLPYDLRNKGPVLYVNVPLNRLKSIIGVNGQVIENIRKSSNAIIKFLEKDRDQVIAICGSDQEKILALNMINKKIAMPNGKVFINVSENLAHFLKTRIETEIFSIYGSRLYYDSDFNGRYDVSIKRGDIHRAQAYIINKIKRCFKGNEYTLRH